MRLDLAPSRRLDLERLTPKQIRAGLAAGLIAESVLLVLVTLLDHHSIRWGYVAAAGACILASISCLATVTVVTDSRSGTNGQATVWFAVLCLAMATLACIDLATIEGAGRYTPALLIGVALACAIGDVPMRVAAGAYAMVLVIWVEWAEGLRDADLAVSLVAYACTITTVTVICTRMANVANPSDMAGPTAGDVAVREAIGGLREVLDEVVRRGDSNDTVRDILATGLPLVASITPVDRATAFVRNGSVDRFVMVATWPDDSASAGAELATLPGLREALSRGCAVSDGPHCMAPAGYSVDGELVLVLSRTDGEWREDITGAEAADLVGAAFLGATSRASFAHGLQHDGPTDPLTGLVNRQRLFERIEVEMAHALRSDTPLTLAMIDLDHFKEYNERHGDVAGDTVLRTVAAVMVSNVRGQDMVARYGGEEFCMVLPETDLVGAHFLLDSLRCGGRDSMSDFGVTLSVGLTSWDGVEDVTSLIERADQALYRAKEMGRNRVVSIQAYTEF